MCDILWSHQGACQQSRKTTKITYNRNMTLYCPYITYNTSGKHCITFISQPRPQAGQTIQYYEHILVGRNIPLWYLRTSVNVHAFPAQRKKEFKSWKMSHQVFLWMNQNHKARHSENIMVQTALKRHFKISRWETSTKKVTTLKQLPSRS